MSENTVVINEKLLRCFEFKRTLFPLINLILREEQPWVLHLQQPEGGIGVGTRDPVQATVRACLREHEQRAISVSQERVWSKQAGE